MDVYVLDANLNRIHIIDNYTSLIWAKRYNQLGDCELYLEATPKNLQMFAEGSFLARDDDDMVCRIDKIQLTTDVENGDYLTVTGSDIKKILAQRIVWTQTNFNGLAEDYIRALINQNIINPQLQSRQISNFALGEKANLTETIREQVTYTNVNDKIQEVTNKFGWGYKVIVDYATKSFVFNLYKGADRTNFVIFSEHYENLSSTAYTEDKTDLANVALTAGSGEGVDRVTNVTGNATGLDRYELYVDADSVSPSVSYEELKQAYPNGQEVMVDFVYYYQVDGVNIAILNKEGSEGEATLTDDIYRDSLESVGLENLSEHALVKSFEGKIEPHLTFEYKKDYDLGDIVVVENTYGISVDARITEVVEVNDENGYSVEPKFEYLQIN